jgi:hypothetical protein
MIGPVAHALLLEPPETMEELEAIIREEAPNDVPLLQSLKLDANGDAPAPMIFVRRLAAARARRYLELWEIVERRAHDGRLAVILPVPPHLSELVADTQPDLVFSVEEDHPPHLRNLRLTFLPELNSREIRLRFAKVESLIIEANSAGGSISTRRPIVKLLEDLEDSHIKPELIIHLVPHMPHRTRLVPIPPQWSLLEI